MMNMKNENITETAPVSGQHIPQAWTVVRAQGRASYRVYAPEPTSEAQAEAYRNLIASAPDLLAALVECERQYLPTPIMCQVRAALLKAGVTL